MREKIWSRPGRSFCWQLEPWLPLEILLMSVLYCLGTPASKLCWHFLLLLELLLSLATLSLVPSLIRSRHPSESHFFWWLLTPEASHVNLPTIGLCNTDPPLCYVDITTHAIIRELTEGVWCGRCWPGKCCACMEPSHVAYGKLYLISTSAEILKRLRRKRTLLLKSQWPRRNFRVNEPHQLLNSLLLTLRLQTGLKGIQVPSVPIQ